MASRWRRSRTCAYTVAVTPMWASQQFLDDDEFDALFQEEGRGRVAEVVEPDRPQAGVPEQCLEVPREGGGFDGVAVQASESEAVVHPVCAGPLLLAGLSVTVLVERGDAGGREGDAAFRADRLGRQGGEAASPSALKGTADAGGAAVEIEVFSVQAQEFALAESGAQGELEQGGEPVPLGCGEELPGFLGGEGVEATGAGRSGRRCGGSPPRARRAPARI